MLNWCRPPNKLCFLVCSCSWKVSIITIYIFDFCFTLTGVAVIIFVTVYVCALIFMFVWWNKTVDWLIEYRLLSSLTAYYWGHVGWIVVETSLHNSHLWVCIRFTKWQAIFATITFFCAVAPIGGGGGGAGGPSPPRSRKFFFLLVSSIQCSIYVHAYQALVHFSTWIDFYRGCWYGAFGMMVQKKFPYAITKNFAPKKFVNWRHCFCGLWLNIFFILLMWPVNIWKKNSGPSKLTCPELRSNDIKLGLNPIGNHMSFCLGQRFLKELNNYHYKLSLSS